MLGRARLSERAVLVAALATAIMVSALFFPTRERLRQSPSAAAIAPLAVTRMTEELHDTPMFAGDRRAALAPAAR